MTQKCICGYSHQLGDKFRINGRLVYQLDLSANLLWRPFPNARKAAYADKSAICLVNRRQDRTSAYRQRFDMKGQGVNPCWAVKKIDDPKNISCKEWIDMTQLTTSIKFVPLPALIQLAKALED